MATRFYLPSTGAADVNPNYDGNWDTTGDATLLKTVTTRISSAMANAANSASSGANVNNLLRQYVSNPIAAQTILVQTLELQIRGWESDAKDTQFVSISVRVVSNDGSQVRGTLLSLVRDETELTTTLTNRRYTADTTEVEALADDRIVIELGLGGDPWGSGNAQAG